MITFRMWKDADFTDTLLKHHVRRVFIQCPDIKDYAAVLKYINPEEVTELSLGNVKHTDTLSLDLNKFTQLRSLIIIGYDELKYVRLKNNISSRLQEVNINSFQLAFPDFDSSLLEVKRFFYGGVSTTIPQWVERLDSLENFIFSSPNLKSINCDLCKLKNIKTFDISEATWYQKEAELHSHDSVYRSPVLNGFRDCHPNIEFQPDPMPM